MRALATTAVAVGSLLLVAALVLFVDAIWTIGPNAGRLAGTASIFLLVGFVLTFAGSCWLDLNPRGLR